MRIYFNPRTSCEVRRTIETKFQILTDISIHAPRVRCDLDEIVDKLDSQIISIHAPRVRCDVVVKISISKGMIISIHAPRVRCDKF